MMTRCSRDQQFWTRHASGVIGAVTRKSSAAKQALARNCEFVSRESTIDEVKWTRHASGVIGAVTRKSSAAKQALARNCELVNRQLTID